MELMLWNSGCLHPALGGPCTLSVTATLLLRHCGCRDCSKGQGPRAPIQKSAAGPCPHPQMQCQMAASCNVCARHYSLCLAFPDADIEFDFVLMTSAYSQYLRDSCKQQLALVGS